jgi:hypothetical protein
MGNVSVSEKRKSKLLHYHKDGCVAIETCIEEYQNKVKKRASTSCLLVFILACRFHEQH